MRFARPSGRRPRTDLRRALAIVLVPALLLTAVILWSLPKGGDVDDQLCLKNVPLAAHTVLVIDRSDPITAANKAYLKELVRKLVADLKPRERFSIYAIDSRHGNLAQKLLSGCSPGTGADADIMTATPEYLQRQFEQHVLGPVMRLIDDLGTENVAPTSPILETLQFLTRLSDFDARVPHRRLVLFSDMLQHSTYSQYRDSLDFGAFRKSRFYDALRADLYGVEVDVHYVPRRTAQAIQGSEHIRFWQEFFADAGARARFHQVAG